eukprot:TRINITY_DN6731_c0_g1_i4.p1 TRINITY_DN6731_c0_g1~~TRINITY_DN6731_c0_g1_i4.p1  ORF type:complete len:429 (-),score=114.77 TRINITY_DN6731_c0_g1_i4:97-1383(-)
MSNKDTTVTLDNGETIHGAPFVVKTFQLLHDSRNRNVISWSPNRDSFIVHNPVEFASEVLPKYFKHNNFCSFIRQLNTYGFKKLETREWEFKHELFSESTSKLLSQILRRKSKKRAGKGDDDDDDSFAAVQPAKLSHGAFDSAGFAVPSLPLAAASSSRPVTPLYTPQPQLSPRSALPPSPRTQQPSPQQFQQQPQMQMFQPQPKLDEKSSPQQFVQVKSEQPTDARDEESRRQREYIQLLLKEVFRLQQQIDSMSSTLDLVTKTFMQQQSTQQSTIDRLQAHVDLLLSERADRLKASNNVDLLLVGSSSTPSPATSLLPTPSSSLTRTPAEVVDLRDPTPPIDFRTASGNFPMQALGGVQSSIMNELNANVFEQDGPDPLFNYFLDGFRPSGNLSSSTGMSLPSTPDLYANIGSPSHFNVEFNDPAL